MDPKVGDCFIFPNAQGGSVIRIFQIEKERVYFTEVGPHDTREDGYNHELSKLTKDIQDEVLRPITEQQYNCIKGIRCGYIK